MPPMGESVAEGTIVRWFKRVGDEVDRDEPLFEISTDKVDAEIPSPTWGVLVEIRVKEGQTVPVPVNSVVAVLRGRRKFTRKTVPQDPAAATRWFRTAAEAQKRCRAFVLSPEYILTRAPVARITSTLRSAAFPWEQIDKSEQ
jgi:pyruvate dehydrogenase E2 component (dihydrolipoamide acetyltransferase)